MASTDHPTENDVDTATREADETARTGKNSSRYSVTDLRQIRSFDEAVALVQETLGDEAIKDAAEEIGTGFTVLASDDKARLIGVPFVILSVDFNPGDQGPFASMMIVTQQGERLIINDGSTGIYAQLDEWAVRSEVPGGLLVQGLRRSDYTYADENGVNRPATTYYLNV